VTTAAGQLVLVATPIGNLGDLAPRAVEALRTAALICCEDTRRTGRLLQHAGVHGVRMAVTNEHTERSRVDEVVDLVGRGHDVVLVSDAGMPGISDPGQHLVRAVLDAGLPVSAVPGPTALTMALVLSGFDTTRFVFEGFLPRSGSERTRRMTEIASERRTTVLYEAPHRIQRTVTDLAAACGGDRRVALARELTKMHEELWRGPLDDAVTALTERDARGEYVVVVEGAPVPSTAPTADVDIVAAVERELAHGSSRKDAVALVSAALGVAKRRVFDIVAEMPRPPASSSTTHPQQEPHE
jgi:16S rRNA (cytidine1402-2'-O)-methyltransferase